jgi:hypothetical protein
MLTFYRLNIAFWVVTPKLSYAAKLSTAAIAVIME